MICLPESNDSAKSSKDVAKTTDKKAATVTTGSNTITNNTTAAENNSESGKSNSSQQSTTTTTNSQPTHIHTWQHIEATGHYEIVVVQSAWDEEVPVYSNVAHDICNVCGAELTLENVYAHQEAHMLAYEGSGHHTEWRYEQTGTQTVHHNAVTEQKWIQDSSAYDKCTTCGEIK